MVYQIPSTRELRELLQGIKGPELHVLSAKADVPYSTLLKIRHGAHQNPRIDTVRKILAVPGVSERIGLQPTIVAPAIHAIQEA